MQSKTTTRFYPKRLPSAYFPCSRCGTVFKVQGKRADRARHFCTRACYSAYPLSERFWAKVIKTESCWIWTGSTDRKGYGQINVGGRPVGAHLVAWVLVNGPMPAGKEACHNCPGGDNPLCVRSEIDSTTSHIWAGTRAENAEDAARKGMLQTKLSRPNVVDIKRRLTARTARQAELAREYGVSTHTINDIAKGRTWRHVS